MSSELFSSKDYLTEEGKADVRFTESYKKMGSQVDRTSKDKFTLWGVLTNFIYRIVHGTDQIAKYPEEGKQGMDSVQMNMSADAFDSVSKTLSKAKDKSLTEKQIFDKTERSLK